MKNYINEKSGILSWLFTKDHKRIGIMYLFTIFAAFAIGGFAALLLRFELLSPDKILLTAKQYNQSFTLAWGNNGFPYLLSHQFQQH